MIGYPGAASQTEETSDCIAHCKLFLTYTKEGMMTDSLDKVDSFGEDDLGTLILVNVDDSAVGSISFSDRVASLSTASSPAIHRTASLYVFDANEKGIDSVSGRILLSASSCPLGSDSEDATVSFSALDS